ncbi:MAG: hypothetical protein JWL85_163 [Candidatus Saccharibacteria bacterium]|nr:hypothetical protein [Candidatus Saccharibacteria bacterium]
MIEGGNASQNHEQRESHVQAPNLEFVMSVLHLRTTVVDAVQAEAKTSKYVDLEQAYYVFDYLLDEAVSTDFTRTRLNDDEKSLARSTVGLMGKMLREYREGTTPDQLLERLKREEKLEPSKFNSVHIMLKKLLESEWEKRRS